jgi:NAD(P)-dependent dehydrogenase (short-subunit alcohol dehydrogenase family)
VTGETTRRTVVAAGGAGYLGRILVADLVGRGHTVAVPTRRPASLDDLEVRLEDAPGRLVVVPLDGAGPAGAAPALARLDPAPSAVVASLGGWSIGPRLLAVAPDAWQRALDDHLTAHLRAMQAYVPVVAGQDDAVYVTTNGAAADEPMPGSGPINVTGAAQRMLLRVVAAEETDGVRFHEVSFLAAVAGDDRNLDPDAELGHAEVADAVRGVLDDPRSPQLVRVVPRGAAR